MQIVLASLLLVIALAIILAGAELFTNSVEWFGKRMHLGEGAVGSILAAIGTAMPETLIPTIAIISGRGNAENEAVSIGAILGAPLMLSTLAFFVTGFAVIVAAKRGKRDRTMHVNVRIVGRDLRFFFLVFPLAVIAAFVPRPAKIAIAALLILAYAYYVWKTLSSEGDITDGHLKPLHFHPTSRLPKFRLVLLQIFVALVAIIVGAKLFVDHLIIVAGAVASAMELPRATAAFLLGVILTPIATELPEKFNSVTWILRKKDTLAMGNITGAMVFQSAIPVTIGILFTPWQLGNDPRIIASAITALLSTVIVWAVMRKTGRLSPYTLMLGIFCYVGYLTYAFSVH